MASEKDIILILGEGGMMGVFVAGALHALNATLRERVRAVYGVSSGADVGAYFVSDQNDLTLRFFTEHLTKPDFIRKNFLQYLTKIFFFRNSTHRAIPDYVNVEYVAESARSSDSKLDVEALQCSPIEFYVKVIEVPSGEARYLPAKTHIFEKLMATSQCGPFSTQAIEVEGTAYIDGGTMPSYLDIDLVRKNKDTLFLYVRSQGNNRLLKLLLYPLFLLAGYAIRLLYGRHIGNGYVRGLFTDRGAELAACENVLLIQNDLRYSSFCTDVEKLEQVYRHGAEKAQKAIAELGTMAI